MACFSLTSWLSAFCFVSAAPFLQLLRGGLHQAHLLSAEFVLGHTWEKSKQGLWKLSRRNMMFYCVNSKPDKTDPTKTLKSIRKIKEER